MLKLLLTQLLAFVLANEEADPKITFLAEFSLLPPHVGANGRVDFFNFENEYLVKTRSRRDYTQLGYMAPGSYAAVRSKKELRANDFQIIFDFSFNEISPGGKNSGFGFWIGDAFVNDALFYGIKPNFTGVGAVIDIEASPSIRFIDNVRTPRKIGIPIRSLNNNVYRVTFSKKANTLTVSFMIDEKEHILHSGNVKLPKSVFFGVTVFSGTSTSTINIERIITNMYRQGSKKKYVKGERKGRSKYIVVLGVSTILGLAYYLYQKDPKDFKLKNK
ncbi:hypothetical protein GINT2_001787 [Glugoides intestinalis]